MAKDGYASVFQTSDVAARYDEVVYAPGTYGSVINHRQQDWLREVASTRFDGAPVQHDYACGTGRIIEALRGTVSGAVGYDVSPAMIERARAKDPDAQYTLVAPDGPVPTPTDTGFPRLVTIFRLLLNVPPEVRDRAIAFAAAALPTPRSGLLVVENHGNRRSLRHVLNAGRKKGDEWFNELSTADVRALLHAHGFTIEVMRGFTLLPRTAYRFRPLRGLVDVIDRTLCRVAALAPWCVNVVYVARRIEPPQAR